MTALLLDWRSGDQNAAARLLPLVHDELHRIARRHMAGERTFDQNLPVASDTPEDLIAIDDALRALALEYERKAQVVELRFFGGLSVEDTAEVLGISVETVMRDWKFAKNWLLRELTRGRRRAAPEG